jgi:3-oxoacyl-[acyl-carrier-protein] synthase-3
MQRPLGWTVANFAIYERGVATGDETSSSLAAAAGRAALNAAGWGPDDLDAIVGACGVMEQPIPGTAALVQQRLGLGDSGIPAFDINATCLSFLVALDMVDMAMAAGRWRRVLIISADIASAALDFGDPEASVIFGDGAAAVAVEAVAGPSGIVAFRMETYGTGAELCRLEAGGTRVRPETDIDGFLSLAKFRMDGPGLFKATARRFPQFIARLLSSRGLSEADIDLIIPHQARAPPHKNQPRALPALDDKVVDIFGDHGNQIAASMPSALHHAIATGRLNRGETALLVGTSAGVSLGGAVIRY